MERRLVLRLLSHWRTLCGERELPSFAELDPAQMPDMWDDCLVLDVAGYQDNPVFRSIGPDLTAYAGMDLINRHVTDAPQNTLLAVSVSYAAEVLRKCVPISRGGEFFKPDGVRVLYRSILLPMSDDGETVSGLLGAANCREVTDEPID
ncbi:MAG: PAS domain-containing protein, partial [Alphaproteobacteria bacterium]